MNRGFFAASTLAQSEAPVPSAPRCGACGLYKLCLSPKMPVTGEGRRKVLILGEAPGKTEDEQNVQLVGESGQVLRKALRKLGVDLDRDCWKTNALICRPPKNATPTDAEVGHCRPNLIKTLAQLQPELIIPLGGIAVKSLLGHLWREDVGPLSRWAGFQIPHQALNAWICPTYHPAYILRLRDADDPAALWWRRHLAAAFELEGRPWPDGLPDYAGSVRRVYCPAQAADYLDKMADAGGLLAFDYETNCLKPDNPQARILSASVCWRGQRTIAYPWAGAAIDATSRLLRSPAPKVAANMKFEERWTLAKLGHGVRNWAWDTVLAAHVLDNRKGIVGLKFQALAWLGADSYDAHIRDYLAADEDSGNALNTAAQQISIEDLLLYNGLDSLLEYEVALRQADALGVNLDGR